ncbi:MAG: flavodoxin family protein [Erysipelotrichaceae bacterium]|nr:flavodoxin family protein [Erysipelotrichaceae bacterium]
MKTIIINTSARKNWNTAMMLKGAKKGAEAAGAETEYIDLFDLDFSGCHSCMACKLKEAEKNRCYWNDDLSPLIDKILHADCVIIGTPIYFWDVSAAFRALLERLCFCTLSYDGNGHFLDRQVNVGLIYTMNTSEEGFETNVRPNVNNIEEMFAKFLKGKVMSCTAFRTLQVNDYSKYCMAKFNEEERREGREKRFPEDIRKAYEMARELSSKPSDN